MLTIRQAIAVEGRYDQNKLAQLVDALIVPLDGFGIFRDQGKLQYLRRLARERGLIILTDPDGAGLVIRNYLRSAIQEGEVTHAYIPPRQGKERRKAAPSREGLLGVEGVEDADILRALQNCGAAREDLPPQGEKLCKNDLYFLGLAGGEGSAEKRRRLLNRLGLPGNLSTGALCRYLSGVVTRSQLEEILAQL